MKEEIIELDSSDSENSHHIIKTKENKVEKNIKVIHEIFDHMKVQNGMSINELSNEHRILLIFIKFFGCPMCTELIEQVGKNLKQLLISNT
jgi:hypothetical protein